jgi:hypothetical protein
MKYFAIKDWYGKALLLCSAVFLILGLSITDDYGVGPDEFNDFKFGNCTYQLYFPSEFHYQDSWCHEDDHYLLHTPFWQMTLQLITKLASPRDISEEIHLRFSANFILFFIAVICFYFLLIDLFREKKWAIFGTLFFILCPRIFAYSFFDGSDSAAVSFWIIGTFSMFQLLNSPSSYKMSVIHSVVSAAALSSRLPLISIPLLTITGLSFLENPRKIKIISIYGVTLVTSVLCFWPQLWGSPLKLFIKSLISTASYQHVPSFFFGVYQGDETPWYYNFFWMGITIPFFCLIPGLVGFFSSMKSISSIKTLFELQKFKLASVVASLSVPLVLPILTNVSLYGAWRHHHFVFPSFAILSVVGLQKISSTFGHKKNLYRILNLLFFLGLLNTFYKMVKYHPYQGVYFNEISHFLSLEKNVTLDSWGNSYKEGLQKILEFDNDSMIPIEIDTYFGWAHLKSLSPLERRRLIFSGPKEGKYLLTTSLWKSDHFEEVHGPLIYSLKSDSKIILKIFRNKHYKVEEDFEADFK